MTSLALVFPELMKPTIFREALISICSDASGTSRKEGPKRTTTVDTLWGAEHGVLLLRGSGQSSALELLGVELLPLVLSSLQFFVGLDFLLNILRLVGVPLRLCSLGSRSCGPKAVVGSDRRDRQSAARSGLVICLALGTGGTGSRAADRTDVFQAQSFDGIIVAFELDSVNRIHRRSCNRSDTSRVESLIARHPFGHDGIIDIVLNHGRLWASGVGDWSAITGIFQRRVVLTRPLVAPVGGSGSRGSFLELCLRLGDQPICHLDEFLYLDLKRLGFFIVGVVGEGSEKELELRGKVWRSVYGLEGLESLGLEGLGDGFDWQLFTREKSQIYPSITGRRLQRESNATYILLVRALLVLQVSERTHLGCEWWRSG